MKLWKLSIRPQYQKGMGSDDENGADNPWNSQWDTHAEFLVRANNEQEARQYAQAFGAAQHGHETEHPEFGQVVWLNGVFTLCEELKNWGTPGVIMRRRISA